jgi:hypothetical protein
MPLRRTRSLARTAGRTAVIAGTATAVSGHVAAKQQAKAAEQQVAAAPPAPEEPAAPPSAMDPALIEQLKSYAQLRDEGILTEEEFAAQKAKLLGG